MAASFKESRAALHETITDFLGTQECVLLDAQLYIKSKVEDIVLILMPWRAFVILAKLPVKIQVSFSFLAVQAIRMGEVNQFVIETDTSLFEFKFFSLDDLEHAVIHMVASLKKVFPDSSPGNILRNASPSFLEKIQEIIYYMEKLLMENQGPCDGFSETYAALCDYSGLPFEEDIQWDVDNIYHNQECKEFNLLDFNHLPSQDVALSVAALSSNRWFTRLSCKDCKLNHDVLEQILQVLSRSVTLEELVLENCGLKFEFPQAMAQALHDHPDSALNAINLSRNLLEDRGIIALSHMFEQQSLQSLNLAKTSLTQKGMNVLGLSLVTNEMFRTSLCHLDLSGNPGSLATEGTGGLFSFLTQPNALGHLDLSGTDCALDVFFDALASGCCENLVYLNLSKNVYSHKKNRDVPLAISKFFSKTSVLQYVSLSGTKLPPEALRALFQGLAYNVQLSGLNLDLSSCELRSTGAQVIQDLVSDASSISDLNLSDNGFDSDMVTLVLAISRSRSIRHVALGRNFNIRSRATLADTLHRIVQLIQDDDCSVESISVADSRLKLGAGILLDGLGSRSSWLAVLDISGNSMGDFGAKILAKALSVNTTLRTLVWDRNNTTLYGFLDFTRALERNFTLKMMPLPMSDVSQACRSHPEKMEEVVHKMQSYLARNQIKESLLNERCHLQPNSTSNSPKQGKYPFTEQVRRRCYSEEEAIMQTGLDATWSLNPQILQKTGLGDQLICNLPEKAVLDQLLTDINGRLMEVQLSVTEAMAPGIIDKALEELSAIEDKLYKMAVQWKPSNSMRILSAPEQNSLLELEVEAEAEDNKIGAPQAELSLSFASSAKSRPASTKDAEAGSRLLPCTVPASAKSLMDLPTAGEKLEHYTRDRPRPNRRNRQPPSKPRMTDGGLILTYHRLSKDLLNFLLEESCSRTAKTEFVQPSVRENDENRSIARLDEGLDEFFTKKVIHEPLFPISLETFQAAATPTPSGSQTFKKKIGHFFAFKRPKSSWGARLDKEPEGSPLVARGRKLMLSDILRTPSKTGESTKALSKSEEGGLTLESRGYLEQSQTPDSARRPRPKYSREGKSQSLILLSGEDEEGLSVRHEKKRPFERSDGELPSSFEQRVHVMLQRIGVTKVLSSEDKKKQSKDGEIKKAGSDGDIVDSSVESPPCSLKSRTHSMSTDPSVRIGPLDVVARTGTEPSSGSYEGRLSWRALGRQLNAELKGKCSELSSSPRRTYAIQEPASPREQKGRERWSSSLPRIGRSTAGPLPRRRTSNAGEGHSLAELQHSYADVNMIGGDNQLKPKPRLKPVANRRAMSVHEEQLRDQACVAELHHAKIPLCLQRSPILKWKIKPKSLLEPETSAPPNSPGTPSQEGNMVATDSKPREEMEEELEQALEQTMENAQNTALDQRTAVPLSKSPTHEH